MFTQTKNEISDYLNQGYSIIIKNFIHQFGNLINYSKTLEYFKDKTDIANASLDKIEKIPIDDFNRLIACPEIESVLFSYIECLVLNSILQYQPKLKAKQDGITIFFIKGFLSLSPGSECDNYEDVIRCFFSTLCLELGKPLPTDCYTERNKDGTYLIRNYVIPEIAQRINYQERKIDYILRKPSFTKPNSDFEEKRKEYILSLKDICKRSFIYLMGDHDFDDFYIPPVIQQRSGISSTGKRQKRRHSLPQLRENWKYIFLNDGIVHIVGGAGYGKSLFLKNIVNKFQEFQFPCAKDYLVIYCELKKFESKSPDSVKSVLDYLQEAMIQSTFIDGITKDMIMYYLQSGRCIILLDALDEVNKSTRKELYDKVNAFFKHQNPYNKICITSRARGFIPPKDVNVMEIQPLSEMDIKEYLGKMIQLAEFKYEDKDDFMAQARLLIQKRFLNNFLVLSLLVKIYKAENSFPRTKTELYQKCYKYIANEREKEKMQIGEGVESIEPIMKESTFVSLAILAAPNNHDISREEIEKKLIPQYTRKYGNEATAECYVNAFLEFCSNRTDLFVLSSTDDYFKFFHRSFFEYFYSRYIYRQNSVAEIYNLLSQFDIDSEVFELTVSLIKEEDEEKYQELISFMLKKANDEISSGIFNSAFYILTQTMRVVDDVIYIGLYFDLLVKESTVLIKAETLQLNQAFITSRIKQAVFYDHKRSHIFYERYNLHCLCYILGFFSDFSLIKDDEIFSNPEKVDMIGRVDKGLFYTYSSEFCKTPAYVMYFANTLGLPKYMEKELDVSFDAFLASIDKKFTKKQKKVLARGYTNYKTLSDKERESVLKARFH